ncbi:unnamed protein product [Merluccius merluccius]
MISSGGLPIPRRGRETGRTQVQWGVRLLPLLSGEALAQPHLHPPMCIIYSTCSPTLQKMLWGWPGPSWTRSTPQSLWTPSESLKRRDRSAGAAANMDTGNRIAR